MRAPRVLGEATSVVYSTEVLKRFISSQFRNLHLAQVSQWRMTKWDTKAQHLQREAIHNALRQLLSAVCPTKGDATRAANALLEDTSSECVMRASESTQQFAVRLWTSAYRVSGVDREVCSIMNGILRDDLMLVMM